jgi:hypothetical protein
MTAPNATEGKTGDGASMQTREPTELEALLPFHAAGTLSLRDARKLDEALAADPELARQYAAVKDEYTETILLNESLGAPSSRAMQKLFAAIDAKPSQGSLSFNPLLKITGFFSSLSPRTLAYSAIAGACVLAIEGGVIGAILMKGRGANFETAAFQAQSSAGTFGLLRFAPDASIGDISKLLQAYDATIVSGPQAGMFRVKFGDKVLPKLDAEQLLNRLKNEKVVSLAVAAE